MDEKLQQAHEECARLKMRVAELEENMWRLREQNIIATDSCIDARPRKRQLLYDAPPGAADAAPAEPLDACISPDSFREQCTPEDIAASFLREPPSPKWMDLWREWDECQALQADKPITPAQHTHSGRSTVDTSCMKFGKWRRLKLDEPREPYIYYESWRNRYVANIMEVKARVKKNGSVAPQLTIARTVSDRDLAVVIEARDQALALIGAKVEVQRGPQGGSPHWTLRRLEA